MTGKNIAVHLQWLTVNEHGRKSLPCGSRYSATIRLVAEPFLDEEWSVRLEGLQTLRRESDALLSFISELAPVSALKSGTRFQLFEGRWPVANGEVL